MSAAGTAQAIFRRLRLNPALPSIVAFALALRISSSFMFPSLSYPDEFYQILEQAHRLAFGYGVIPWDFEDGIRSYFMPLVFAALMWLVSIFADSPNAYVGACHIALAVFSVIPIIWIYQLGLRRSVASAVIASMAFATSFEAIYFSSRTLSEPISSVFLIVAICEASGTASGRRRQILIGFLLAFSLLLRVQFAPAIAIIALYVLQRDAASIRDSATVVKNLSIGALGPALIFGACDTIFLGAPFLSYYNYVDFNFLQGKANNFGVGPVYWYVLALDEVWCGLFPLLAIFAFIGGRNYPLVFWCGLVILLTHSLIPHKEYRYVAAADVLFLIAASLYVAQMLDDRVTDRGGRGYAAGMAAILAAWMMGSSWLAFGGPFGTFWYSSGPILGLQTKLYSEPALCGVFVRGEHWWLSGGYAYLHRNAPMYFDEFDGAPPKAAYNYEIARFSTKPQIDPDYSLAYCLPERDGAELCVWRRDGECVRSVGPRPILERKRLGLR
jgi:GPI mannosyltransferase 3